MNTMRMNSAICIVTI